MEAELTREIRMRQGLNQSHQPGLDLNWDRQVYLFSEHRLRRGTELLDKVSRDFIPPHGGPVMASPPVSRAYQISSFKAPTKLQQSVSLLSVYPP